MDSNLGDVATFIWAYYYPRRRLASAESIVTLDVCLCVCASAEPRPHEALVSAAKVMRCIQCSLVTFAAEKVLCQSASVCVCVCPQRCVVSARRARLHATSVLAVQCSLSNYKKGQLSLTNPRDACEKFARFT